MPVPHHYKYFLSVHEISQHLPAKSLLHFQWRAGFFPTQPYFCLSLIRPCTTFDAELFPEVVALVHLPNLWPDPHVQDHPCGRLPAPGFPHGWQTPCTGTEFVSSHFVQPHQCLNSSLFASAEGNGCFVHLSHFWHLVTVGMKETFPARTSSAAVPHWAAKTLPVIFPASLQNQGFITVFPTALKVFVVVSQDQAARRPAWASQH